MSCPPLHLWGVAGPLEPLEGGSRNQVFWLRSGATDLVFKSTRRSAASLLWLNDIFDMLGQNILVPRLIPSQTGALVEQGWTCEPYMAGSDLTHLETLPFFGQTVPQRPGFCTTAQLVTQQISGDINLGLMPPTLVTACRAAWSVLKFTPIGLVHGDLNLSNMKRAPDGRLVVLDWDEARVDALSFDDAFDQLDDASRRARTAYEIATCWQVEPDRARHLAERFLAETGP